MLSMDPIEYLRLYMTMWEQWLQKYETYKYHGDIMRCKKGIALIPIYKGSLQEKHPPIYYQYHYTGDESFGYVSCWRARLKKDALVYGDNCMYYRAYGVRLPYDQLYIRITNPKCDGSFSAMMQFEDITCGVQEDKKIYRCWCELTWGLQNPFATLGDIYSKWSYVDPKLGIDYWWWRKYPRAWSYFYTFNWRYYPISKKYDYWDSAGRVAYGKTPSYFQFGCGGGPTFWSSGGCGLCYRYLGVIYSNICVYRDIYIPPP